MRCVNFISLKADKAIVILLVLSLAVNILLGINYFRPFAKNERDLKQSYQELLQESREHKAEASQVEMEMLAIKFLHDFSADWSPDTLYNYLSSDLLAEMKEENMTALCQAYTILGKYNQYSKIITKLDKYYTVIDAIFENGKAKVVLTWIKENEIWKITMFRISSELFFDFARHSS